MLFQYCTVRVVPDQLMVFGGKADACAQASLMSIGKLGVEENKAHAQAIYEAVEKLLGIPPERYTFSDLLIYALNFRKYEFSVYTDIVAGI